MRTTVFRKALCLILSAVMLLGLAPVDSHAQSFDTTEHWTFPAAETYFDDIRDYCGCQGGEDCTHSEHADTAYGSIGMYIDLPQWADVYAPVAGTLYLAADSQIGNAVIIEQPRDSQYSLYIVLAGIGDSAVNYASAVNAGDLVAYSGSGELVFIALMAEAGRGGDFTAGCSQVLAEVEAYGWLTSLSGKGLVSTNPAGDSQHPGSVEYSFVGAAAPVEPATEAPTEAAHTEHSWDGGVITTPPTHFSTGLMTFTCTVCSETFVQELPASADHVYDQMNTDGAYLASGATCQSPALYYYSCTCGAFGTETFAVGDIGEHSWANGVCTVCGEAQPTEHIHDYSQQNMDAAYLASGATCQSPALYYYSCTCGAFGTETFAVGDIGEHSWANGVCTVCGEAQPTEHIHDYSQQNMDAAYLASGATCQSPALYYYSCACGAFGTETFAVGDIGEHSWANGVCTVCGEAQPTEHVHAFDQMNTDASYLSAAASCTSGAVYFYSCTCGEAGPDTFVIGEAKGHTFADGWSASDTHHWHAAACEHTGEVSGFGEHSWNEGKITAAAGHNQNGEITYTCTVCGQTRREVVLGEAHSYDQEVVDAKYLKSPATCTSAAQYYKSCICGEMGTETFASGEPKGHTYSDNWSSNDTQHWQAATCGHDAQIKLGEHIWDAGTVTVKPTSTTQGQRTFTCVVCKRTRTETLAPTEHTHTYASNWGGNESYHWHSATCEHSTEISDFGPHIWDAGRITVQPSHGTQGEKVYTCTTCGVSKREVLSSQHVYDQRVVSNANLKSYATCTSPAVYYVTCTCGAKGTETFTYGTASGHVYSAAWSKDDTSHYHACTSCGAKSDVISHYYGAGTSCTTCGYTKQDAHVHTSHLTRMPSKQATCTADGCTGYYVCDCGKWFTDVTATMEITDQSSVVTKATGHVDKDNNGRCDVCKERISTETVEYTMVQGAEETWLNTSNQGMVFRSNADYDKFDHVEVDGVTISSLNYTISSGSTIVELSASYMKRLTIGQHSIAIVAKDGRATANFTVKQGSAANTPADTQSSGGSALWTVIGIIAILAILGAAGVAGYMFYQTKFGGAPKKRGGKYSK